MSAVIELLPMPTVDDGQRYKPGQREADDVADDDDSDSCEGHESLNGADMGRTVYCDGSCR